MLQMMITDYLKEVEHAVTTVITEIHRENDQLSALRSELAKFTAATDDGYHRVEFLAMNPDLDDEFLGTGIYWDTYFGVDKDRFHKGIEIQSAVKRVAAHEFSISTLSGCLLQFGKQGISLHFGRKRACCPDGRILFGMPLHEVIWQARNQALHWEDNSFRPPIEDCFQTLAKSDPVFSQYKCRSLAYEIVLLLGWRSLDDFRRDLMLLNV